MPDDTDFRPDDDTIAVPGALYLGKDRTGKKRVRIGPSAGWMVPNGILGWERELSLLARADLNPQLSTTLRATLPHEQIASKRFPLAARAAAAAPFLPISNALAAEARRDGVRVHTVGVDRVSAGFFYFIEGGDPEPVRLQGNLVEMLAPSLDAGSTNADIDALLDGLIDRLLRTASGGALCELDVELADALPRLSRDGSGLKGTDLEGFEAHATTLRTRSLRYAEEAKRLASALTAAPLETGDALRVPLFESAWRERRAPLKLAIGGRPVVLPEQVLWYVTGSPRHESHAVAAVASSGSVAAQPAAPVQQPLPAAVAPEALKPEVTAYHAPPTPGLAAPETPVMSDVAAPELPMPDLVAPLQPAPVLAAQIAEAAATLAEPVPVPAPVVPAPVVAPVVELAADETAFASKPAEPTLDAESTTSAPPVSLPAAEAEPETAAAHSTREAGSEPAAAHAAALAPRPTTKIARQTPRVLAFVLILLALLFSFLAYRLHWLQWP